MSAFVVSREHIDVLVRAADHFGRAGDRLDGFRWWRTDESGDYVGWRILDQDAEIPGFYPDHAADRITPSQLGQILVDANVRSVAYRYPDDDPDAGELPGPVDAYYLGPYVYRDPGVVMSPGEVFAAIDCLDYQSCEDPEWERSEAASVLRFLRKLVCRSVEGFEEAGGDWTAERLASRRGAGAW